MLETITGLLASGGVTGIVGLIGGLFQRGIDIKVAKIKAALEKTRLEFRHKEVELESQTQLQIQQTQSETDIERDVIAANTADAQLSSADYRAALKSDKATYSKPGMQWWHPLVLVDMAKGMVRIVVVIWLLYLLHEVSAAIGLLEVVRTLSPEQRFELAMHVINGILQLCFLSVGFYFGQRAPAPSKHV